MRCFYTLLACLCIVLGACSPERMVHTLATPGADRFARDFIQQVRRGDPAATRRLAPNLLRMPGVADSVRAMVRIFPRGPVQELELLNAQVTTMSSGLTTRNLTYQEHSAGGWAVVEVMVVEDQQSYRYIGGARVTPIQGSLTEANAFTLTGKGAFHWLMLVLVAALPLFCIAAAVRVIRTPMPARWLWGLLCLVAVGAVQLNWSAGAVFTSLVHLQLLGSGAVKQGIAAPWVLSAAFPLGAVLALAKRRRFLRAGDATPVPA